MLSCISHDDFYSYTISGLHNLNYSDIDYLGSIITLSPLWKLIKTAPIIYRLDNGGCFFKIHYNHPLNAE